MNLTAIQSKAGGTFAPRTMYRRSGGVWVPVTGGEALTGPNGTPLLDNFNRADQPLTAQWMNPQPDPSRWLPTAAAGSGGINTISSQRAHQDNYGINDALTNWATPFSVEAGQGVEVWCEWVQFPSEEPQGSYFPFLNPLVLRVGSYFEEPGPHGPSGAIDGDIRPYTLLVGRPSADNENWWDDSVNGGWIVLGAGTNQSGSIGSIDAFETKTDPIPATVAEGDTWALSVEIAPDPDERTLRAWRRPADGEWSEVSNWTTPKPTAMTSNPDELDVGHIGFGLCGPAQIQDPLPIIDNFGGGEFPA